MKGYAVLIGVEETNIKHFGDKNHAPNASTSVEAIYNYLKEHSTISVSEQDKFIKSQAILKDIELRLETLAEISHNEPIYLFLYLVGHGMNQKLNSEDIFTFFKLYDQMLFENELKNLLKKFHWNSKIFCVIDSCNAGGMFDERFIAPDYTFGIKKNNFTSLSYDKIINLYNRKLNIELDYKRNCSTFIITSVGQTEWANMDGLNGMFHFSYFFLKFLEKSKNYCELFDHLKEKFEIQVRTPLGDYQMPQKFTLNSDTTYFKTNKPLIIKQ